jgi:hypothetical protein
MNSLNTVCTACLIASLKYHAMIKLNAAANSVKNFPTLRIKIEHNVKDIACEPAAGHCTGH